MVLDGSVLVGTGAHGTLDNVGLRGTGLANPASRSTTVGMMLVQAGTHSVEVQASQPEINDSTYNSLATGVSIGFETPTDEGVCVGNRTLVAMRFPRGKWIGG